MPDSITRAYLGRGWSFPPNFNPNRHQVELVQEEMDIEQSLTILLGTRPGERIMQPDYGCNLDVMLFEPLSTTLITIVRDQIRTAILFHEPRIDLLNVTINTLQVDQGLIMIEVEYRVRSTNSRFNFVYDYYLNEGSTDI